VKTSLKMLIGDDIDEQIYESGETAIILEERLRNALAESPKIIGVEQFAEMMATIANGL